MASKSTSSNSPSPLRSHSQRQLARLRPRLPHPPDDRPHRHRPLPAVEPQPLQQSPQTQPAPSPTAPHAPPPPSAAAPTPSDSTSTVCRSPPPPSTSGPRLHQLHGYPLCFPFNLLPDSPALPAPPAAPDQLLDARLHNTAQCSVATAKSLPRLSSVRCRTRSPLRSERTKSVGVVDLGRRSALRVLVRRMNM